MKKSNYENESSLKIVVDGKYQLISKNKFNKYYTYLNLANSNISSIWITSLCYLKIEELNISNNNIKFIPDIFSLKKLICDNCDLRQLPKYMPRLEYLSCKNNKITLIPYYNNLKYLDVTNNLISSIVYNKLEELICSDNPIIEIPPVKKIKAYNCPILSIGNDVNMEKYGVIINNRFKWMERYNIEIKYSILNWKDKYTRIKIERKFNKKLFKFLFNNSEN